MGWLGWLDAVLVVVTAGFVEGAGVTGFLAILTEMRMRLGRVLQSTLRAL